MEKDIRTSSIDIVIKAQEGAIVFEIKDPKRLNRALLDDIKQDFSVYANDSVVIFPEQKVIDSQRVFIENTSRLL